MMSNYNGLEITTGEDERIEFYSDTMHPLTPYYHQWVNREERFGSIRQIEFKEKGVHLWLVDYTFLKDTIIRIKIPDLNCLSLFYTIGDDTSYVIKGISKGIARSGYFNMAYLPSVELELKIRKKKKVTMFGINLTHEDLTNFGTPPVLSPMLASIAQRKVKLLTISQYEFTILPRMKKIIDHFVDDLKSGKISTTYPFRFEFTELLYVSFQITGLYRDDKEQREISIIKAYIDDELKTITVPQLIDQFNYNKASLRALFHKHTGHNANDYIRIARLDRAWELLLEERKQIKVIAKTVGYKRPASFANAFKKHHGLWPHEVKMLKQKTDGEIPNNL